MEDEVLAVSYRQVSKRDGIGRMLLVDAADDDKVTVMQVVERHGVDARNAHDTVVLPITLQQACHISHHLRVRSDMPVVVRRDIGIAEACLRKLVKRDRSVQDLVVLHRVGSELVVRDRAVRNRAGCCP